MQRLILTSSVAIEVCTHIALFTQIKIDEVYLCKFIDLVKWVKKSKLFAIIIKTSIMNATKNWLNSVERSNT